MIRNHSKDAICGCSYLVGATVVSILNTNFKSVSFFFMKDYSQHTHMDGRQLHIQTEPTSPISSGMLMSVEGEGMPLHG